MKYFIRRDCWCFSCIFLLVITNVGFSNAAPPLLLLWVHSVRFFFQNITWNHSVQTTRLPRPQQVMIYFVSRHCFACCFITCEYLWPRSVKCLREMRSLQNLSCLTNSSLSFSKSNYISLCTIRRRNLVSSCLILSRYRNIYIFCIHNYS
jgi:hypothetical protein